MQSNPQNKYLEYLTTAYKQVVNGTLKDESLRVLSEMDNKEYYYQRINELFIEIYSAQREEKIQQLFHELELCRREKDKEIIRNDRSFMSEKCIKNDERGFEEESYTMQYKVNLALKENQQLASELKHVKQAQLSKIKTISSIHEVSQDQMKQKIDQLKKQCEETTRKYKQIKQNYISQTKKVEELGSELLNEKQKYYQIEIKVRSADKERISFEQAIEKYQDQIQNLKQCKVILEDKNRRLENNANFQKQKIQAYEKQIQIINENNYNISNNEIISNKNSDDRYREQNSANIISNLTIKEMQIVRLKKDKQNLQLENSALNRELAQCKTNLEKTIIELKQFINKTTIEYQRQIRIYRQKQKQGLSQTRQIQINSKINQLAALKQQLKLLEQEKFQVSSTILKVQHSNKVLTRNYQQLANTLKHVQAEHEEKVIEYEEKLEKYRKIEKQLTKRIKIKQDGEFKVVEGQLRDRLKHYQSSLQQTNLQLQSTKKSQQKLLRQLQLIQKQNKRSSLNEINKNLLLKEHQLQIKIHDLQNMVEENKMINKEIIDKKQQKIKGLKKEVETKDDQIIELTVMYQRQNKQKISHEKGQKQLQKQLRLEQEKILQIQQTNRDEIVTLMKTHQNQLQDLNRQFERYHGTSKNKSELNDKLSLGNSLKNLQKQYYEKINNLEKEWSQLKANNLAIETKYKEVQMAFKECNDKLEKTKQELQNQRNKSFQLEESLQKYKNKEVKIVKFYEGKINGFKCIFKQFKYEICHQFRDVVTQLRADVYQIKKNTLKMTEQFKKMMITDKHQTTERIYLFQSLLLKSYEIENNKTNLLSITKLQKQKQQLKVSYQLKIKQKQMDMMTVLAEKQFLIQQIKQSQALISKKYKDLETNYEKIGLKLEKVEKSQSQLKEIIQKMQNKVDDAEKNLMIKQKQAQHLQKVLEQNNEMMKKSQALFKKQLTQCKQKHRQENEKIFNRFQREFNKITNINMKKNKDKLNLGYLSQKNLQIPTKGNDEDRIVKLKREIQQQKRIVHQLECKNKY